jgi:hypothetical protein
VSTITQHNATQRNITYHVQQLPRSTTILPQTFPTLLSCHFGQTRGAILEATFAVAALAVSVPIFDGPVAALAVSVPIIFFANRRDGVRPGSGGGSTTSTAAATSVAPQRQQEALGVPVTTTQSNLLLLIVVFIGATTTSIQGNDISELCERLLLCGAGSTTTTSRFRRSSERE